MKDKKAIITGGTGVIGSCIAKSLVKVGVGVALLGRNRFRPEATTAKLKETGGDAIGLSANVIDSQILLIVREEILRRFGTVDILINCTGVSKAEATTTKENKFFNIPINTIKNVFYINFTGTVLSTSVFGQVSDGEIIFSHQA